MTKRRGYRDHGRGTLVLDRVFPGVGRLKRASGTKDQRTYDLLVGMLGTLYNAGRLDLLRAIKTGVLTPFEVWEHFRTGQLQRIQDPEALKPLRKTALAWVQRFKGRQGQGIHERHRDELKAKLTRLADLGDADSTIAALPKLLVQYRAICEDEGTHRTFNYAKAAALAFIRSTLGRQSPLYRECSGVEGLVATVKRKGNPQTVEAARALKTQLGPAGDAWWVMCCTGMGPTELWDRKWEVKPDHLVIKGSKRERRLRVIPRLVIPMAPAVSYRVFAKKLEDATDGQVEPYDGRRTFAHWMELAGIPRSRRKAYHGHAGGDMLALYERHEVSNYLADDLAKLTALLGDTLGPMPLKVVK